MTEQRRLLAFTRPQLADLNEACRLVLRQPSISYATWDMRTNGWIPVLVFSGDDAQYDAAVALLRRTCRALGYPMHPPLDSAAGRQKPMTPADHRAVEARRAR